MRILYIGDIMAEPGLSLVEEILPALRCDSRVDIVIAQAENVSDGKGLTMADYRRLKSAGVDGFSGGNHSVSRPETHALLIDAAAPVTAPANMPGCPGPGYKYIGGQSAPVLIISLLGQIVGRDANLPIINPLQTIDRILQAQQDVSRSATIINFHGDFSSEKVVIGHYLDGRVTAVIGDHWHVPTADARVLPGGTAHVTDVGMCGALDSSLGVAVESIIPRWRDGRPTKNVLATTGPRQFNAVLIETNPKNGLARSIERIQRYC